MPSMIQQIMKHNNPETVLASLGEYAPFLPYLWSALARSEQLPDKVNWWDIWFYLSGRGGGKTRAGAEWVRKQIKRGKKRGALVAGTAADVRDIMIEGESGLLSVCSMSDFDYEGNYLGIPHYEPSKRKVSWANGATVHCYSAEKPDRLRGPQHEFAWADELATWMRIRKTWDNLLFGLRLGVKPQCCVTSTPRPLKLIKELVKDPTVYVTKGTSYDNKENLAKSWYDKIIKRYEGTRLGRQELNAEILEDNIDALWTRQMIEENRVKEAPEDLVQVVVAIDPAVTSGEDSADTGIIAAGEAIIDGLEHYYVLDDRTCHERPTGWAKSSILAYDYWMADRIIGEVNNGGDMIETVIRSIRWPKKNHTDGENVAYDTVRATRGKYTRAEPISALSEQGRLHFVGFFPHLEDQCCQWSPNLKEDSPDRLDAMVWAITSMMEGGAPNVRHL